MTIWISRDREDQSFANPAEIYFWQRKPVASPNDGFIGIDQSPLGYLPLSAFTNPIAPGTCVEIKGVSVELL